MAGCSGHIAPVHIVASSVALSAARPSGPNGSRASPHSPAFCPWSALLSPPALARRHQAWMARMRLLSSTPDKRSFAPPTGETNSITGLRQVIPGHSPPYRGSAPNGRQSPPYSDTAPILGRPTRGDTPRGWVWVVAYVASRPLPSTSCSHDARRFGVFAGSLAADRGRKAIAMAKTEGYSSPYPPALRLCVS